MVRLSLIVPTYRRPHDLLRCLRSIQDQSLHEFELLVVDNSRDADVRTRVEAFNAEAFGEDAVQHARVRARYVHEPELGLHNARHAGARNATGDVLVFTDDDAEFDANWLAAYAGCFDANPGMAAAGGRILPKWDAEPPGWLCRLMQADPTMFPALSLLDRSATFELSHDGFFFGVNMAIRREALFASGGFNPEIFGSRWLGDGETGLNRKLWASGESIGYVPDALVYHHVTPQRMTLEYLTRRQSHEGACDMYARFHHGVPSKAGLLATAFGIVKASSRDFAAALVVKGRTEPRALRVQLRAARARARLEYVLRLMLDPTLRSLVTRQNWL